MGYLRTSTVLTNAGKAEHKQYTGGMVWGRHGKLNDEPTTALLPGWCTLDELYTCAPLTIRQVFVIKGTEHLWCCQRPVFLLGVSQHMHKITNL